MSQQELLKKVVGVLTAAGIEYMVTGSIAASLQGEPRASHDIDLVVSLTDAGVAFLWREFPPPRYYLDRDSIESARRSREHFRQFNLLEVEEGDKVGFWLLSDEPFDRSRFARRYEVELSGFRAMVSRAEDTILMKLAWAKMSGGSEKQMGDCLAVFELQFGELDLAYLKDWAVRLSVEDLWKELKSRARPL